MYINDDSTLTPTFVAAQENPNANYGTANPGGSETLTLRKSWKASENFGPGALSDPNLQGTAAANPTEQQVYTISATTADATSTWQCYCTATIDYEAVWQELKDITNS